MELEAPTNLDLAAAAVDRPVSELRDLNPALLKPIAPAGYRLHVPKGTVDQLNAALRGGSGQPRATPGASIAWKPATPWRRWPSATPLRPT